tara:strand:- start:601 stop:1770 length:1170 start_codon:yes stop_codon:yes gene_type:complete
MSLKLSAGCKCCDTPTPVDEICICGDVVQMVLIFQDEARQIYSPSGEVAWDADVADWEEKILLFGAPEYAQLCQVWRYGATVAPNEATSVCKPSTRDMPDGWTWDDLVRSPTEAQCKAVYDSAKGGAGVDDPTGLVLLGVDVSGSMNLDTLGDGYTDFKDYLTSISVEYEQVLFTNERWVQLTTDNYVDVAGGDTPEEVEITLDGLYNGTDCDICEDLVGDFTLTDPVQITEGFDADGWSGDAYSRAADVPYGTTHACVWKYETNKNCSWSYSSGDDVVTKSFSWAGYLLARFRIAATDYEWRLIVLYKLELECSSDFGTDEDEVNSGWYWEHGENNPTCAMTGSESWTAYFPEDMPLLNAYCYDTHEAEFSDFCDYTLTLENVETVVE